MFAGRGHNHSFEEPNANGNQARRGVENDELMEASSSGQLAEESMVSKKEYSSVARNMRPTTEAPCCSEADSDDRKLESSSGIRAPVCLRHRLSRLFGSERMADAHFLLNANSSTPKVEHSSLTDGMTVEHNTVRFPAHRLLLAVASPVFDAMFNGQMAVESNQDIEIPDVELPAFMDLLKFIYTDQVELSAETVMAVLYAAKKYAVDSLQERCVDFLRSKLSRENAFLLLSQARLFDEAQLASICLEVIDRHTSEAMATESFLDIDLDTLCAVLQRDALCIRENRLFSNVHRWAVAECARRGIEASSANKRSVLGKALDLIRFPLMTPEEFANDAAQTGLLEDSQVVALFLWYLSTPKPTSSPFSPRPRCCTAGRELVCARFQHVELRWGYSGTADKIKFSVSRPIYVVGLGLFGSVSPGGHYNTQIQVINCETREVMSQNEVDYDSDGSKKPVTLRFREPVALEANQIYMVSATIRGPDTFYGTRGQRVVVVDVANSNGESSSAAATSTSATSASSSASASSSVAFTFSYACSSNNGTSVEDGQISDIVFFA